MILFSKNALILWMLWPVQLLNGHKPLKKIMAGLLNQYLLADNTKALNVVKWMADYFNDRVWNVIRKYTVERHYQSLNEEVSGMNDVLYRCFSVTNDTKHLVLAHLFDKPYFLGPLALQLFYILYLV